MGIHKHMQDLKGKKNAVSLLNLLGDSDSDGSDRFINALDTHALIATYTSK